MSKKIALVHDHIQEFGGAERVLVALHEIFPQADVYTSFYNPKALGTHASKFESWKIFTSWASRIPLFRRLYSPLRFLTPLIWESIDLSRYDIVISSSGWYMSKGIKTRPDSVHICYLHHPPRYLYGYETAVEWQKYWPVKIYASIVNYFLRIWDFESSQRVNYFVANSKETKSRIEKFYRKNSKVIYPPVSLPSNLKTDKKAKKYFITTSRLAKAKHIDILIGAANKYKFNLKVIGSGRDETYLKSIAGDTVEFLSRIHDDEFADIYKHAKGFLFASVDEEFGIAPIEAMGYGIPVIAYASGGLLETVDDGKNGFLYDKLSIDSLMQKITKLEKLSASEYEKFSENAILSAKRYSFDEFKKNILNFVQDKT